MSQMFDYRRKMPSVKGEHKLPMSYEIVYNNMYIDQYVSVAQSVAQ